MVDDLEGMVLRGVGQKQSWWCNGRIGGGGQICVDSNINRVPPRSPKGQSHAMIPYKCIFFKVR